MESIRNSTKISFTIAAVLTLIVGGIFIYQQEGHKSNATFKACEKLTTSLKAALKCAAGESN